MNRYTHGDSPKKSQHHVNRENANRSAELDELNFSDDESRPTFVDLENESEIAHDLFSQNDANLTKTAMPGDDPTNDDMSPETLILEDGARSPHENGSDEPVDQSFTIVGEREIGGGNGMDEAELGRAKPLDGKPWDGNPDEPLNPENSKSFQKFAILSDKSKLN